MPAPPANTHATVLRVPLPAPLTFQTRHYKAGGSLALICMSISQFV